MPQHKYKIIDNSTGESFVISSDVPPSKQAAKQILEGRKKTKREGEQADYDYENRGFFPKLAESIYGPSEALAPKVLSPEEQSKLSILSRIDRKVQQVGSSLLDPQNFAVAAPALTGPIGLAASSIVGGAMMLKDAPEVLKNAYEHPNLENAIDVGVTATGLLGAAHGGIESGKFLGETPKSPWIKPPEVNPITDKSRLLSKSGQPNIIDAEFVDQPQIEGHVREAGGRTQGQIVEAPEMKQIEGTIEGEKLLSKKVEKPVRGPSQDNSFVVGAPKEIIPTTERPVEILPSDKVENKSTALEYGTGRGRQIQEKPTGFQIMKEKGLLDENEVFPIEEEVQPEVKPKELEVKAPEQDVHAERELASTRRMVESVSKVGENLQKEGAKPNGGPTQIQNDWLRQLRTETLQEMKESNTGQLRTEIETVLGERGIKEETKVENTVKEEPISEEHFISYQQKLDELASFDNITNSDLDAMIDLGEKAGLDADTIESDLIDNTPRLTNGPKKIQNRVGKRFGSERGGVKLGDIFPESWFKKSAGTESEGPIKEAWKSFSAFKASLPRLKPEDNIGKMGEAGKRISQRMEDGQFYADKLKGQVNMLIHDSFKDLTPREIGQRIAVLDSGKEVILNKRNMDKYVTWDKGVFTPKEGVKQIKRMRGSLSNVILDGAVPASDVIKKAAELFRQGMDILHTEGESSRVLTILDENGKKIPFTKEGADLWSRDYTKGYFDSLLEGTKEWNKIVRETAARHGVSLAEAEKALKVAKENGQYKDIVTRADHRNILKQDSFVIDPNIVFDHVNKFSGRVGMAEALGPRDIHGDILKGDLDKLQNEGFNSKYAKDTITRLVGKANNPIPGKLEATTYKAITDLNNFRLMTSFIINNLANVTTTIARVGPINTMKGLGAMLGNLEMSRRVATLAGSIEHTGALDNSNNRVSRILGVPQSERFMRTWADQSGRITANSLLDYLQQKDLGKSEFARGKELLDNLLAKDSLESINRGKLLPEELDRAGWQLAKDSQAIINPATMPPLGEQVQTPLLRLGVNLAMQYKRMAMLGMSSLTESFRLNPSRTIATILITAPVAGELIGDAGSALFGAAAGTYTGEGGVEGAIRDVNDRGKSLNNALKPLLQKKLGLSSDKAFIVSRYIEDLNRGFALGLIGDILFSTVYNGKEAGPDTVAGGIAPAWGLIFDVSKDIMKDDWIKVLSDIAPQRPTSAIKRSRERMKGSESDGLTVHPPSMPKL